MKVLKLLLKELDKDEDAINNLIKKLKINLQKQYDNGNNNEEYKGSYIKKHPFLLEAMKIDV